MHMGESGRVGKSGVMQSLMLGQPFMYKVNVSLSLAGWIPVSQQVKHSTPWLFKVVQGKLQRQAVASEEPGRSA